MDGQPSSDNAQSLKHSVSVSSQAITRPVTTPLPVLGADFCIFAKQLSCFFKANGIFDSDQQKSVLLSVLPAEKFSLTVDLFQPDDVLDSIISYDQIINALINHQPRVSKRVARLEFDTMKRAEGESVNDWSVRLNHAAANCKFSRDTRDERLCDRFIAGLNDSRIVKSLVCEDDLTYADAITKAEIIQKSLFDAAVISGECESSRVVAAVDSRKQPETNRGEFARRKTITCFGCGQPGHQIRLCRNRPKCSVCKRFGHMARDCVQENRDRGVPSSS